MKKTKMLKKNYEFKKILSKGTYYSGKNIEVFIKKENINLLKSLVLPYFIPSMVYKLGLK